MGRGGVVVVVQSQHLRAAAGAQGRAAPWGAGGWPPPRQHEPMQPPAFLPSLLWPCLAPHHIASTPSLPPPRPRAGYATLVEQPDAAQLRFAPLTEGVHGVLYSLGRRELGALAKREGGYRLQEIEVGRARGWFASMLCGGVEPGTPVGWLAGARGTGGGHAMPHLAHLTSAASPLRPTRSPATPRPPRSPQVETYDGHRSRAFAFVSSPLARLAAEVAPTERYMKLLRQGAADNYLDPLYQAW